MKKTICKLGIIGTGRIAHRFVPEAGFVEGIEVVAVYNSRITSAEKFAEEFSIAYYTDNLEKLFEYVDAVYIASPHETHYMYAKRALEVGKHVLCEKPMTFSKIQVLELGILAQEKDLVLMEAIKTAYCPGFLALLEVAKSGKIGEIIDVEACFTKLVPINLRELSDKRYGGSFTEMGTYTLLPIVKLLGTDSKEVKFRSIKAITDVDAYTKVFIDYGNAIATAKTGLGVKSEGQLLISGTKGYILVPSPWWLTRKFEIHYEDPNHIEIYEYPYEKDGLRYEIATFVEKIAQILSINENKMLNKYSEKNSYCILGQAIEQENYLSEDILESDINIDKSIYINSMEIGITIEESAWIAEQMAVFLEIRKVDCN
ncbi:MAG: Gfo/Idh/MocA family oxidoreductase [Lachnospiraceae bacterium]|nr:Gfo/Idh/MocA family oxidoreductase [Lachnospiraceae bacterium]